MNDTNATSSLIRSIDAVPVRVGRRAELLPKTAHGETQSSEYALVRVVTNSGHVGIGEITTAASWNGEEAVGSVDLLRRRIGPHLLGLDVANWTSIAKVIDSAVKARPFLRAGIEMACLDADARRQDRSVASLLGAVHQQQMPLKVVLPARDLATVRTMTEYALAHGAQRLKVKVGTGLDLDLERVGLVRELHSGPLSVDANEGWLPQDVDAIVEAISESQLSCVEQPFSRNEAAASRSLQRRSSAPVMADESVWSAIDVASIADTAAFNAVSLYPGKLGGIRRFLKASSLARARGLQVVVGSNLELGIGTAAMTHALAVTEHRAEDIGHDIIGPLYFEHSLVTDPSFVTFSEATLPSGPGLGVELDIAAVFEHQLTDGLYPVIDLETWL